MSSVIEIICPKVKMSKPTNLMPRFKNTFLDLTLRKCELFKFFFLRYQPRVSESLATSKL